MNSKTLKNFGEEKNNNIPYITGYEHIGDFCLEKCENDKKIIDDAKVGYTIYGVKSIEELKKSSKKIIVVIPALTGTCKVFEEKASQGNGWANIYGKKGNILDPNDNIIIGLDYFGSFFNNHKDKHNLKFYPVPPEKQVEAWKKALLKLGVKNVDILFGGSNGGGHIHHWELSEDKILEPNTLIPVAGPVAPTAEAKDFFKLQLDFLNGEDVSARLEKNLENLKGNHKLYKFLIKQTLSEINKYHISKNDKKIMKTVRQIGFLKFVGPSFFDRFYKDKNGKKLNISQAKENMLEYFKKEGVKFEKRFGKSYLKVLLEGISNAKNITPEEYVKKVSNKIDLVIISIEDDKLFDSKDMEIFFTKVRKIRKLRGDTGKTIFKIVKSNSDSIIASHDYFLWSNGGQIISNNILKEIKKLKEGKNIHT